MIEKLEKKLFPYIESREYVTSYKFKFKFKKHEEKKTWKWE